MQLTGSYLPGAHYAAIKWLHIGCVLLSGMLFTSRGVLAVADSGLARHALLRRLSIGIDTILLLAALSLASIIHQWPFTQAWLTAKLLLLVAYIGLGLVALRPGRRAVRATCLVAALLIYGLIISIAITHDALGFLRFV